MPARLRTGPPRKAAECDGLPARIQPKKAIPSEKMAPLRPDRAQSDAGNLPPTLREPRERAGRSPTPPGRPQNLPCTIARPASVCPPRQVSSLADTQRLPRRQRPAAQSKWRETQSGKTPPQQTAASVRARAATPRSRGPPAQRAEFSL